MPALQPQPKDAAIVIPQAELQRAKALQNKVLGRRILGVQISWHGRNGFHPEVMQSQALHALGSTASVGRSKQLMKQLVHMGVFDEDGTLLQKTLNIDSLLSRIDDALPAKGKLKPQEKTGIATYMAAMLENLGTLGQDIHALPAPMRPSFLYYAGIEPTPQSSAATMKFLRSYGILHNNLLPKDGGAPFDVLIANNQRRATAYVGQREEDLATLNRIRDLFFPLPAYAR